MEKIIKLVLSIIFTSLIISCKDSTETKKENNEIRKEPELILPNYPTNLNYENLNFHLLFPGDFEIDKLSEREKQILETPNLNNWIGLYKDNLNQFSLSYNTYLSYDLKYNDVHGYDYINIYSESKDSLIFCITDDTGGDDILKKIKAPTRNSVPTTPNATKNVINAIYSNKTIALNSNLEFEYKSIKYSIVSKGTKSKNGSINNFSLLLNVYDGNPKKYILISNTDRDLEKEGIMIFFAGDIDLDGKVDFYLDAGTSYCGSENTLYLSSFNYNIVGTQLDPCM